MFEETEVEAMRLLDASTPESISHHSHHIFSPKQIRIPAYWIGQCSLGEASALKLLQLMVALMGSRELAGGSLKTIGKRATHSHFHPGPINSGSHKLPEKQQHTLVADLEPTQSNTFWMLLLHRSKVVLTESLSYN